MENRYKASPELQPFTCRLNSLLDDYGLAKKDLAQIMGMGPSATFRIVNMATVSMSVSHSQQTQRKLPLGC